MAKAHSLVNALRAQAAAGRSVVEVFRSLRDELAPGKSFGTRLLLLERAFDAPADALYQARYWIGWSDEGWLTDADLVALLSPLVGRTDEVDHARRREVRPYRLGRIPRIFDRPFTVLRYIVSHATLTLRSDYHGDLLDLTFIGVRAMRLRAGFGPLTISDAFERPDVRAFAAIPERYEATHHYLGLSDGEHEGFVVCGGFGVRPDGQEIRKLPFDDPAVPGPETSLPVFLDFVVYTRFWEGSSRRLELNNGARRIVFSGVLALQLPSSFHPTLTISDGTHRSDAWAFAGLRAAAPAAHRVLSLTNGISEGFVVCHEFSVH